MRGAGRAGVLLALVACAAEPEEAPEPRAGPSAEVAPPTPSATPAPPPRFDPAAATAILEVRVLLEGAPPRMRNIDFSSDAHCAAANPSPVPDPSVVVREGRLANAVVWVSKGAERWSYAPTEEPVEMAIERCMLSPHVVTLRTGQPLRLVNRGSCNHGIHAIPSRGSRNPESNTPVTRGAPPVTLRFPFPETPLKLKCDVHTCIRAWAAVFDHPIHAVTDDRGEAFLRLPPGEFEVSVWHEFDRFARPEPRTVCVEEGGTADLEFVFETR